MKYIEYETNKGKYRVPLKIIATNRTEYYAENDGFEKGSVEWEEEMDFIMNDDFEAIDWLGNNMDLVDIKKFSEKIENEDEDEDWINDSFKIVEL